MDGVRGLPFVSQLIVTLVTFTAEKVETPGAAESVAVEPVTVTVLVEPVGFKLPD